VKHLMSSKTNANATVIVNLYVFRNLKPLLIPSPNGQDPLLVEVEALSQVVWDFLSQMQRALLPVHTSHMYNLPNSTL
jgi:hypothetical protein